MNLDAELASLKEKSRPIVITPYKPEWIDRFRKEATKLRNILANTVVRIDHIGSTSVANLAAKDIIDIQITLNSIDDADQFISRMREAGYRQRGDIRYDYLIGERDKSQLRKLYFREAEGSARTHIHVRQQGLPNQEFPLLFRDYLVANEPVRIGYELIKKRLANIYPESINGYLYIKVPVMGIIYQGAKMWAENTNWKPDSNFV